MKLNEKLTLKLISEMKKPGRECLYDMSSKTYKNNHFKQSVWLAIANAVGVERSECQALWKNLRRRYKTPKNKNFGKSGSKGSQVKSFLHTLSNEMDYFKIFWRDEEPPTAIEEQKPLHLKVDNAETELKESLKTLNNLASAVVQASSVVKRDPFFLALEDEFAKVPENRKSALKLSLMSVVIDHQNNT